MNFLGHLLCTHPHPLITLGNVAGDFVHNRDLAGLHEDVRFGVLLHRQIDLYTDRHEEIRAIVELFRESQRKYAPVFIDIVLDHVLSNCWNTVSQVPFKDFTAWVYDLIARHHEKLPSHAGSRLKRMSEHQWLHGYGTPEGIEGVLRRMDLRASFPSYFQEGVKELPEHVDVMTQALVAFMPDLQNFARDLISRYKLSLEMQ